MTEPESNAPSGRALAVERLRNACATQYGMSPDETDALIAKANEVEPIRALKESLARSLTEAVDVAEAWYLENPPEEGETHTDGHIVRESDADNYCDVGLAYLLDYDSIVPDQYWDTANSWFIDTVGDTLRKRGVLPKRSQRG